LTAKRFNPLARLSRPFLSIHPLWALLEMWVLGLLLLFALSRLAGAINPSALANGTLMMCGLCGVWAVFRTRVPQRAWWQQMLMELAMGAAVSVIMVVGLGLPARWLGWDAAWTETSLGSGAASLLRAMTGFGYLVSRVGVRLWLFWNRLRRRRMLWSLTHAHLTTAFVVMVGVLVLFVILLLISRERAGTEPSLSPIASFATLLLHSLFPAVGVMVVFTLLCLVVVMPPSALLSFFAARKTTRRLDELARAARAWRSGEYAARVEVSGQDEVAQLQADFNAMAESLETTLHDLEAERDTVTRLLQSRRELVANVSHELRTPVATMRALLESTLNHRQDTAPQALQHELEVMRGEVERLQTLIGDLFTLSQAQVGHLQLDCQPTDVAPIVQQVVDAVAPLAWQSGRVQVTAELPTDLPRANVDGTRLAQIMVNLIRNAVRHTPPGGIVAAMADADLDWVRIEVRDTGEGIPAQDLPHIWERFYRGSKERDEGSAGLGLALVKELAEAMGGTVAVESEVGQGSCFTVRLPKERDDSTAETRT
jgi:signal transduction histidine kinase